MLHLVACTLPFFYFDLSHSLRLLLKHPITCLSVCICISIFVGDILVVKPPLFMSHNSNWIDNVNGGNMSRDNVNTIIAAKTGVEIHKVNTTLTKALSENISRSSVADIDITTSEADMKDVKQRLTVFNNSTAANTIRKKDKIIKNNINTSITNRNRKKNCSNNISNNNKFNNNHHVGYNMVNNIQQDSHTNTYFLGVLLAALAAFFFGLGYALAALCNQKGITMLTLLISNAVFSILLSIVLNFFFTRRFVSPSTLSILAALFHVMSYMLVLFSVFFTQRPTLISIVRSSEIPIAYGAECLLTAKFPDTMSVCGAVVIMFAIAAMAHHDQINQWLASRDTKKFVKGQQ